MQIEFPGLAPLLSHKSQIIYVTVLSILILTGCTSYTTKQPVSLEHTTYDSDPLVDSIMNPQSYGLQAGDLVRVLSLDGKTRPGRFEARSDTHLMFNKRGWFGKSFEIPIEEVVFIEKDLTGQAKDLLTVDYYSLYPVLETKEEGDKDLPCPELELALLKTDVLRTAINDQINTLTFGTVASTLGLQFKEVSSQKKILGQTLDARRAARQRLLHLSQLWIDSECSPERMETGMDELQDILSEVEALESQKQDSGADVGRLDQQIKNAFNRIR